MLEQFRGKSKTIIFVLISLIIPGLVLFGISSAVMSRKASFAGKIFGKRVSVRDYNEAFKASQTLAMFTYGQNYNKISSYLNLDQLAWERLILLAQAQKEGLSVSDKQLVERIQSNPFFQIDGAFNKEIYETSLVRFFRMFPETFEDQERSNLLIEQLVNRVKSGVLLSSEETLKAYRKNNERIQVQYVLFNKDRFAPNVQLDDPRVLQHYEENAAQFRKDEQRQIEFFYFNPSLTSLVEGINDTELKEYYDNNKEEFVIAKDSESADAQTEETAYQSFAQVKDLIEPRLIAQRKQEQSFNRADQVVEFLLDNNNNMDLAAEQFGLSKQTSEFFSRNSRLGQLGGSFSLSAQAFSMQTGEVSDIIREANGFYVMRLVQVKPPHIPPFQEVQADVLNAFKEQLAQTLSATAADNLRSKIIEKMQNENINFADAVTSLKLELLETDAFTLEGYVAPIGYVAEFNQAAFRLEQGEVSQVIPVSSGSVLLAPLQKQEVSLEDFENDEQKDKFQAQLLRQKQEQVFSHWLAELKDKAALYRNPLVFEQNPAQAS